MGVLEKNENKPKYRLACQQCACDDHLVMVAHRNKYDNIVGWILVCITCFPLVSGKKILTKVE